MVTINWTTKTSHDNELPASIDLKPHDALAFAASLIKNALVTHITVARDGVVVPLR